MSWQMDMHGLATVPMSWGLCLRHGTFCMGKLSCLEGRKMYSSMAGYGPNVMGPLLEPRDILYG